MIHDRHLAKTIPEANHAIIPINTQMSLPIKWSPFSKNDRRVHFMSIPERARGCPSPGRRLFQLGGRLGGTPRPTMGAIRSVFNVANVEVLPIPMLPVSNCSIMPPPSLEIGIGYWQHLHTGNIPHSPRRDRRRSYRALSCMTAYRRYPCVPKWNMCPLAPIRRSCGY